MAWHLVSSCFSGAGQDVGRSCILVSIAGKNVMLDCGMHMGFSDDVSPERRRPGGTSFSGSSVLLSAGPQASEPRSTGSGKVGSGGRQVGLGSLRSLAGSPPSPDRWSTPCGRLGLCQSRVSGSRGVMGQPSGPQAGLQAG